MTKNNKHTDTQIHKTQDQVAPAAGKQIKPKQGKITTQSNKSLPAQRCSTAVFKLAKAEADDDNIEQQLRKNEKREMYTAVVFPHHLKYQSVVVQQTAEK
mgnify:CR=1 FL=1